MCENIQHSDEERYMQSFEIICELFTRYIFPDMETKTKVIKTLRRTFDKNEQIITFSGTNIYMDGIDIYESQLKITPRELAEIFCPVGFIIATFHAGYKKISIISDPSKDDDAESLIVGNLKK